jgi:hypothetical protein
MITYLTSLGLSDAQIQLISGHESKKSLEIYQHLSLGAVELAYQEAKADGKGGFRRLLAYVFAARRTLGLFRYSLSEENQ